MRRLLDYPAVYKAEKALQAWESGLAARKPDWTAVCRGLLGITPLEARNLATPEKCGDHWRSAFDGLWADTPHEAFCVLLRHGWDARHRNGSPALCGPILALPCVLASVGLAGRLPPLSVEGWADQLASEAARFTPRPTVRQTAAPKVRTSHNGRCFQVVSDSQPKASLAGV